MTGAGDILRDNALARLDALPFFADVALVNGKTGMTKNTIEDALATLKGRDGRRGVAVLVDSPAYRSAGKGGAPLFDLALPVTVFEDAMFNRGAGGTGKTVSALAEAVIAALHNVILTPGRAALTLGGGDYRPQFEESAGVLYVTLEFTQAAALSAPPKVPMPLLTADAGGLVTVSIAPTFAAAEIFYTQDGGWPSPRNPAAQQYLTPFVPEPGALVCAVAFLDGYEPSDAAVPRPN
jgi:hypothetical protein